MSWFFQEGEEVESIRGMGEKDESLFLSIRNFDKKKKSTSNYEGCLLGLLRWPQPLRALMPVCLVIATQC